MPEGPAWETRFLPDRFDLLAPDGSQIRLLPQLRGGSMVHCSLLPGAVTRAVRHRSVEELWYVLAGEGQLWRSDGLTEHVTSLRPGVALSLPLGTSFQFRTLGAEPLAVVIVTLPPWPGEDEAIPVPGAWDPILPD
jgi:mannose-6-phosphate isomerase-like protein (cupin superfamily)